MQVTEQSPTAAGEFERVLDARLIMSVVAAAIKKNADVVVETAMNVTFPALMDEFGVNTATVQWMTTAYLLVLAVIMPPRRISTDASPPATSSWWPEFSTSRASYAASAPSRSPMLLVGRVLADGPIRWFPRCSWRSPSCSRRRWARPIWPRLPLPARARPTCFLPSWRQRGSPVRRSWLCGSIAGRTRFVRKAVAPSVWDVCARRVMG